MQVQYPGQSIKYSTRNHSMINSTCSSSYSNKQQPVILQENQLNHGMPLLIISKYWLPAQRCCFQSAPSSTSFSCLTCCAIVWAISSFCQSDMNWRVDTGCLKTSVPIPRMVRFNPIMRPSRVCKMSCKALETFPIFSSKYADASAISCRWHNFRHSSAR